MRDLRLIIVAILISIVTLGCGIKINKNPEVASKTNETDSDPNKPTTPAELVEHPSYKLWCNFAPGAQVTQKTTTDSANTPGQTVTTIVYTLKEKSRDHVLVETQATTVFHGGRVEANPPSTVRTPRLIPLPPGASKESWGKSKDNAEEGEESVAIAGKAYPAKWRKSKGSTDAGELFTTIWTSPEIPGGLAKSLTTVPAVNEITTIEVTNVVVP